MNQHCFLHGIITGEGKFRETKSSNILLWCVFMSGLLSLQCVNNRKLCNCIFSVPEVSSSLVKTSIVSQL